MSYASSAPVLPVSRLSRGVANRRRTASGRAELVPVEALLQGVLPIPENDDRADDIDLRQLRHHTKNTLQRLLCVIAQTPGLCDTPAGEQMARELENRIALSATISDALFGLTRAPGSLADRLRSLGDSVIQMMSRPDQMIALDVSVRGACPSHLTETVLRVAHEFLGNAVKHGMVGRDEGRIVIRVEHQPRFRRLRVTVTDDGRGFTKQPLDGEGMSVARGLAERFGGTLRMWCDQGTVAMLDLPTGVA